jgi:hypothetical protein
MEAAGTSKWASGGETPAGLPRAAVATGMALLALAGGVVLARKMSGALIAAPPAVALACVGVSVSGVALGYRRIFADVGLPPRGRLAVFALPTVIALVWFAALSLPETSGVGLVLLYGPVLLTEGFCWGLFARQDVTAVALPPAASPVIDDLGEPPAVARGDMEQAADASCAEFAEREDHALAQQVRRRDAVSGEVVEGWVRVDFAAGQRHAASHVAICPPMERNPACYAEVADGPDAGVKVTQAMSYGVRIEVKLAEPAEEAASVIVEYSILEHAADGE